ncbi:MAG: hypothetical protein AABW47_00375 [Nanoarchaeota archaeon]
MTERQKIEQMGEKEDPRLIKIYETEVKPLIDKEAYDKAFDYLAEHPELKPYLSHAELRTMHDFAESVKKQVGRATFQITCSLENLVHVPNIHSLSLEAIKMPEYIEAIDAIKRYNSAIQKKIQLFDEIAIVGGAE